MRGARHRARSTWDAECRVLGVGLGFEGLGFEGFRDLGLGFWGVRVLGKGFRVSGFGIRG
jgi:hypothetical protein